MAASPFLSLLPRHLLPLRAALAPPPGLLPARRRYSCLYLLGLHPHRRFVTASSACEPPHGRQEPRKSGACGPREGEAAAAERDGEKAAGAEDKGAGSPAAASQPLRATEARRRKRLASGPNGRPGAPVEGPGGKVHAAAAAQAKAKGKGAGGRGGKPRPSGGDSPGLLPARRRYICLYLGLQLHRRFAFATASSACEPPQRDRQAPSTAGACAPSEGEAAAAAERGGEKAAGAEDKGPGSPAAASQPLRAAAARRRRRRPASGPNGRPGAPVEDGGGKVHAAAAAQAKAKGKGAGGRGRKPWRRGGGAKEGPGGGGGIIHAAPSSSSSSSLAVLVVVVVVAGRRGN
uniref:Uncharacterized protein n=1 Tax=Arundo donax TaxID=35708 RepID=A0A0A9D883_ARUDO